MNFLQTRKFLYKCRRRTGWQNIGGKWYHFSVSGRMENGHLYKGNNTYYLNTHCYYMYTGWNIIDEKFHYFAQNGARQYSE
ncbi:MULTISPECIES: hypothetical protein [Bacillus]|uniref:hypothetical protein n=1 Tax=Bacillus TaxID=1386 RepID=UPI0034DD2C6B